MNEVYRVKLLAGEDAIGQWLNEQAQEGYRLHSITAPAIGSDRAIGPVYGIVEYHGSGAAPEVEVKKEEATVARLPRSRVSRTGLR